MDIPPATFERAPVFWETLSLTSEFERADVGRAELSAAVGVDRQGIPGPAAQVLDLVWLDLGQRADTAQGAQDVIGKERTLAIFKCLKQGGFDSAFDFRTG